MINLLPIENKILVKKEYLKRLVLVFGFFSLITAAIAVLLLVFLLFLVDKEKNDYEEYFTLQQKHLSFLNEEEVVSFVNEINSKVKFFEENGKKEKKASEIIKIITETKTKGILINYFSLSVGLPAQAGKISFNGTAKTRNELLSFVESLKKEQVFKKVDSPISNFLKESNVKFNVSIDLYEE
ncbi:MAG: hypothetical protein WC587_03300 [Candidatus Paceibacterota bacterium]